jgi:hypothetical protein
MDPIRIDRTASPPSPPVSSETVYIPFEGFNPRICQGRSYADWKLAEDLPPFENRDLILEWLANKPALAGRIIEYREYTRAECGLSPELTAYLEKHRGDSKIPNRF